VVWKERYFNLCLIEGGELGKISHFEWRRKREKKRERGREREASSKAKCNVE